MIVIDESNTCGPAQASAGARAHDWLTATGGAIGYGIPTVGAAIAGPDRLALRPQAERSRIGHHVGVVHTGAGNP